MQQSNNLITTRQNGFNLLEVLIGIAIFAIGMMALASLQGNLTRSAADASVRTVAVNIAEEVIESRRGFARITTDPDGVFPAYEDITSGTTTVNRGGISYTVTANVTDYYYDLATDGFTTTAPGSVTVSDYKLLTMTVAWTAPEFRTVEGQATTGSLGSGSVTVSETISSVTSAAASKVVTQEDSDELPVPAVDYNPGSRPDIVSLSLGDNKFKESLLPEPDVIRQDELVETRFDVITYSQTGEGALFLRREEFVAISCECELKAPPGTAESAGRRPTLWAGDEYKEGHFVDNKPYGVSALSGNQQSAFCDICCRDHHDGGSSGDDNSDTAVNMYYPFRPAGDYWSGGTFNGDHMHYGRNNQGDLVLAAAADDVYLESCKLVRKDGFFKVAQDFRQEDLHVFPGDFLDDEAEVDTYSAYVTGAADAYENASYPDYETAPPCIGGPSPCVAEPAMAADYPAPLLPGQFPNWTPLPLNGELTQQLRSRGMYIDYLSYDLRTVIDCLRAGGDEDSCQSGDIYLDRTMSTNILEIIPFYEVQLTFLDRWNENPIGTPVETTNEGLADDNSHSRGMASRDAYGCSDVKARGHRGNLGFTDTASIDNSFTANLTESVIDVESVDANGLNTCLPLTGNELMVSGTITETVNGLKATDIEVEGQNGALCDRTPIGYECVILETANNPKVKFFGYGKSGTDRWTCMVGVNQLTQRAEDGATNGENAFQVALLYNETDPQPDGSGYDVNVQSSACPAATAL